MNSLNRSRELEPLREVRLLAPHVEGDSVVSRVFWQINDLHCSGFGADFDYVLFTNEERFEQLDSIPLSTEETALPKFSFEHRVSLMLDRLYKFEPTIGDHFRYLSEELNNSTKVTKIVYAHGTNRDDQDRRNVWGIRTSRRSIKKDGSFFYPLEIVEMPKKALSTKESNIYDFTVDERAKMLHFSATPVEAKVVIDELQAQHDTGLIIMLACNSLGEQINLSELRVPIIYYESDNSADEPSKVKILYPPNNEFEQQGQ